MSMPKEYNDGIAEHYQTLLDQMEIKDSWQNALHAKARALLLNRKRYEAVAKKFPGMPWTFIAVIHNLESGGRFDKHLHNGDPLTGRTVRVPAGYPKSGSPPFTWEHSATDALNIKGLKNVKEWSMSRICYELERFNGFGYFVRNMPSPYLWSGTNVYKKGKFVADHRFDANAISQQIGAIPLLMTLDNLDPFPDDTKKKEVIREIKRDSSKLSLISKVKGFVHATWISIASIFTLENFSWAKTWIDEIKVAALDYKWLILMALAGAAWAIFKTLENKSIADYLEGRYVTKKEIEDDSKFHTESPDGSADTDGDQPNPEAPGA